MSETTYDVLARVLRDNDEEIKQSTGVETQSDYARAYADGLGAASARLRAAMVCVPKPNQPAYRGKPPEPIDTAPRGKVIDAEFTSGFGDHSEWTMPKDIPSP